MRPLGYSILTLLLLVMVIPAPVLAAGVTIENFSTMSAFQSSPLYSYLTGGSGLAVRKTQGVRGVRQGPSDVPTASAGAVNNVTVTPEILSAARDVPEVFSLSSTASFYDKKFVSLGTSASGEAPFITLDITPASSSVEGGYNGYDIVVFDLGKNLATGTGNNNTEGTTFQVELVSAGVFYEVGSITATMGNFINAVLLDITGVPGIPPYVDAVRITDVTGGGPTASGGIDVDGALTLNLYTPVAAGATTWGKLKSLYAK